MKVTCTGRRVTLKPSFVELAEKNLAKLDKFFAEEAQAQVTVTVEKSGQTVELTPMEFDILLLLARRPGQVFTARQIYEAVAADSFDASWTGISSMVYKLRRKLGAGIIETVRGHGYKFIAPGASQK